MFVYRDEYYKERDEPRKRDGEKDEDFSKRYDRWTEEFQASKGLAELNIAKQRNGPIGSIKLVFDAAHGYFYNLEFRDVVVNGY
jgi:replicative DNA helicase